MDEQIGTYYDSISHDIEHQDDTYYNGYYDDHYSYIQQQHEQQLELKLLRRKLFKEKSKLKKEKESIKQERESLKQAQQQFDKEKAAQKLKWDEISTEINAKLKNKQIEHEHEEEEEQQHSDLEKDAEDASLCKKSIQKKHHQADHEKCHRVNQKLKSKLESKAKECEELQTQIEKLRGEIRQSHDYYEKFLEYERTVIKQKFDIKEFKKNIAECEQENDKIRTMYQDLTDQHQALTNKYKEEMSPYFEFTEYSEPSSTSYYSSSPSTTSLDIESSQTPEIFIRTPLKNRPRPIITRNSPSIPSSSRTMSSMPPSFGTTELDEKLDKVNMLNQQIKQLRHQLLTAKRTKSRTRSRSNSHSRSRTRTASSAISRARISSFNRRLIEHSSEDDDIILPLPMITTGGRFEIEDKMSTISGSTYQGVISYDTTKRSSAVMMDGECDETMMTMTMSRTSTKTIKGADGPKEVKKGKKRKKFWRLFGICSSKANDVEINYY